MACPRCGEVCHCHAGSRTPARAPLRPKFEVDAIPSASAVLVDPEQYDASEEQFSASLESPAATAARFIPDPATVIEEPDKLTPAALTAIAPDGLDTHSKISDEVGPENASSTQDSTLESLAHSSGVAPSSPERDPTSPLESSSPDAWKEEVAARLSSYRAKRKPRPPKYPSLSLDFPAAFSPPSSSTRLSDSRSSLAEDRQPNAETLAATPDNNRIVADEVPPTAAANAASARVIEFPRFFTPAEESADELAEPVCEHPRILDAPEVEVPPPALGGIVLETSNDSHSEERPGFEVPLRSASITRRLVAALTDFAVVTSAGLIFAYIFLQIAKAVPPVSHLLASAALVTGMLWAGYQYLLLTYAGTTPGLRIAKLQLTHFDGSAVPRPRRRWRVLASCLSAVSLGLGFAWCFLDEDALCWHDRITRTHLVPRN